MKRLVLIGLCVLFITGTALADLDVKDSGCKWELKSQIEDSGLYTEICFWTAWKEDNSSVAGIVANEFQAGDSDEKGQIQINVPDIEDIGFKSEDGIYEPEINVIVDKYEAGWDVNSNAAYVDGAWQDLLDRWIRL